MFHRHNCEKQPCPCEQLSKHADPGRCPCLVGLASTIGKLDVLPRMRRLVKCSACVSERRSFCSCHSQMRFGATYDLAISQTISSCAKRNATRKKRHTCLAQRRPQELHKSLFPDGPLLHSGVVLVWQFAQSFCSWPAPFLRLRFFLAAKRLCTSSAKYLFLFSICRSSYCQLVLRVVFSSSKTLSSEASDWSWCPIWRPSWPEKVVADSSVVKKRDSVATVWGVIEPASDRGPG